jgi:hypothetical protein
MVAAVFVDTGIDIIVNVWPLLHAGIVILCGTLTAELLDDSVTTVGFAFDPLRNTLPVVEAPPLTDDG